MLEAQQGGAGDLLGYDRDEKYYNDEPQTVYESTNNKLLWDFKIQTNHTTSLILWYWIR